MKSLRYYIDLVEEEEFTFSPEQEKFLGNADRQDPHILKRMPGPKPPISYFKNPEDQEIAKQLNFGRQNVNAVTQAFGGSPDEPETFSSGTRSLRPSVASTDSTSVAPPVAEPVAPSVATTNAVTPGKITSTTALPPPGDAVLDPAQNPDKNTSIPAGPQGPPGRVPPKPAKKLLPVDEKLKPIQEKLKAMGYDLGPTGVDGRLGKYTKQAIDDFNSGKPPGKPATAADKKTTGGKTQTLTDQGKAQIAALKKQEAEQRAAGDKEGAEKTRQAITQLIIQISGNPGETPPAKKTTPEQDKSREEALSRLEKQAKLGENFNKLTAVEQIQKIRQIVDEAEIIVPDRSGGVARDAGTQARMQAMRNLNPAVAAAHDPFGLAKNVAADAGASATGKAAKSAMGSALKKASPLGIAFGAYDAYNRGKEGDWLGAGLAGAGAIASFFPGPGTAIALGLDAINIGRDVAAGKFDGPKPEISPQERAQVEKDWKTLEPYFTNPELFKSLPAKDQERLTKLKQRAADLSTAAN
jgi:hypothetical protein